jgi:hypothetical protein
MDSSLFARVGLVQTLLVAVLFAVLVALPLGDDFFEDYGWLTGPVAWLVCAALTARILALPASLALFAAAAGGIAGALVGLTLSHTAGLVVGVAIFAASCAGHEPGGEAAEPGT